MNKQTKKPLTIKRVKEIQRLANFVDSFSAQYNSTDRDIHGGDIVGTFNLDPAIENAGKEDYFNGFDIEQVIFKMPRTQVAIMLFRHLGYNTDEITEILKFKNKRKCYNYTAFLKRDFLNIKKDESSL